MLLQTLGGIGTNVNVNNVKLYEAMFLVDSAKAAADWAGIEKATRNIFERSGAELLSLRKWDERQLTYAIKGLRRGTYILTYFRVNSLRVKDIERDIQLSETFMRALILTAEGRETEMKKETPLMIVERLGGRPEHVEAVPAAKKDDAAGGKGVEEAVVDVVDVLADIEAEDDVAEASIDLLDIDEEAAE